MDVKNFYLLAISWTTFFQNIKPILSFLSKFNQHLMNATFLLYENDIIFSQHILRVFALYTTSLDSHIFLNMNTVSFMLDTQQTLSIFASICGISAVLTVSHVVRFSYIL